MSDTCPHCGRPHYLPNFQMMPGWGSRSAWEKNAEFAFHYGAGPKRICEMITPFVEKEKNMNKLSIELIAPEGFEFTGEFREAKTGEYYAPIQENGEVSAIERLLLFDTGTKYYILRRAWVWPEWLTAKYIAMDQCGIWYAFETEPRITDYSWGGDGCYRLSTKSIAFTPPHCTNWKQSLRKNPNA